MQSNFEQDKNDKLRRLKFLRYMHNIGMIAWHKDRYQCAQQKIRILHPLSLPYISSILVFSVLAHGILNVSKELKTMWKEETVWW